MPKVPHNWKPEPHQLPVITNPARFKILVWHRKCHKTTLAVNELVRWASAIKGVYWYVFPYLNQAKKDVWQDPDMMGKYTPPEIWEKRNNSETYVTFPNGSVLYVLGSDNPEMLRGGNPRGIILDEYADMKPEVWKGIIQPIMAANPKAWCWFIGTPKGKNDLYQKYLYAQQQMSIGGVEPTWYANLLKASDTGIILPEALEEAKKTTTEAYYNQEYNCEFLEGASQFFTNVEGSLWKPGILNPQKGHRYRIGVDLAKHQDWSVLTPVDLTTFQVGMPERFNQVDYTLQKARIEAMHLRFNNAEVVMDSTGVGEPIYDDLVSRIRSVTPYTFTENSRRDLLVNLQLRLAKGDLRLPPYEQLVTELKAFQYQLVISGASNRPRVKIAVPDDVHDDCVMSLGLAVWNLPRNPLQLPDDENQRNLAQFDARQRAGHPERAGYFTGSKYLSRW